MPLKSLTIMLLSIACCPAAMATDLTQNDNARGAQTDNAKNSQSDAAKAPKSEATKIAQYGIASFKKGDYQTAVRYLSARARLKPEDCDVYYYLGNCYLQLKQPEQAAHMFSACVRVSPTSQAGKYSLSALESLSSMPKTVEPAPSTAVDQGPDPEATAATKESLMSEKPLDKAFNDAVAKIKGYRQSMKVKIDHIWLNMQDEMQSLNPRTPTYAADLERLQREAENKVQDAQTKELRLENRIMAADKIDVRAIPIIPTEKTDDSKTALGSLLDYFKPEAPFDPFGTDIKPELTSKFMTIRDLFGELPTYQSSARKLAKQVFAGLKNGIENKQDQIDQQLYQLKANLIRDVVNIKINYGNTAGQKFTQVTAASFITGAKMPRNDSSQMTPMDMEIQQAVERSKKRIKELEDSYYHEVDVLVAGAKEKLGGMVAQTGQMNSQMQKPSGNIQLVPLGTDMYTRNYINFGDRTEMSVTGTKIPAVKPVPLKAEAKKLPVKKDAKDGVKVK